MCSVLAVLDHGLLIRMVLAIHMALGMLHSVSCCRQVGTGIHFEADKMNMQSWDTLPPPGDLDWEGKDSEVAMDSRIAADIQVAMRK